VPKSKIPTTTATITTPYEIMERLASSKPKMAGVDITYSSNTEATNGADSKHDCVSVSTINKKHRRYNSLRHYLKLSVTHKVLLTILVGFVFLNSSNYCSAGFACLSNPCVFGVCIDDLNR
jgi:protein eyes shut